MRRKAKLVTYSEEGSPLTDPGARRRFRAVLFDLYDTLVWLDVDRSNEGRRQLASRVGVSPGLFMDAWRRSVDDRMLGRGGTLADHLASAVAAVGVSPEPSLIEELVAIERRRLEESVHLYPGAVMMLRRLAASGYRLGLLSNLSDGAAVPIIHLGIAELFDEMILSHEVGLLKPDPAIFRLACRRLGVATEETMFVADGGFGELDAAWRLGIYSVLIEQDKQSKDFGSSTQYHARIQDLRELDLLLSVDGKLEPEGL